MTWARTSSSSSRPRGDETRRIGPRRGTDSGVFVGVNRNKRSVAVDLRHRDGRQVLDRLLGWADVVVDNLRPRPAQTLGLDFESVHARNPRVVSVSVSTFGSSGPVRRPSGHRPGGAGAERADGGHRVRRRRPGEGGPAGG